MNTFEYVFAALTRMLCDSFTEPHTWTH